MIDLATVSSKGQVVIPRRMRAGLGFSKNTKLILMGDKEAILMKKLSENNIQSRMRRLLDTFSEKFKKESLKETDIKKEIQSYRSAK